MKTPKDRAEAIADTERKVLTRFNAPETERRHRKLFELLTTLREAPAKTSLEPFAEAGIRWRRM